MSIEGAAHCTQTAGKREHSLTMFSCKLGAMTTQALKHTDTISVHKLEKTNANN